MLKRIQLRHLILAGPVLATAGIVVVLAVVYLAGVETRRLMAETQHGHAPAVELSRDLETMLGGLQRRLQDAVAAQDLAALGAADSVANAIRGRIEGAADNPVVGTAEAESLKNEFDGYYGLARPTTTAMIDGTAGADLMDRLRDMTTSFNALRERLEERSATAKAEMASAFEAASVADQRRQRLIQSILALVALGTVALAVVIFRAVIGPLRRLVEVAEAIGRGDFSHDVRVVRHDEIGTLSAAFREMTGEASRVIGLTADYLDAIRQGEIPEDVDTAFHGQYERIRDGLNDLLAVMRGLTAETEDLIGAARRGDTSARANPEGYAGAWQELVQGLNDVLEAQSAPMQASFAALERAAARDLTARVDGDWQGDYAAMRDNVNRVIALMDDGFSEVGVASEQVALGSQEIARGSQNLASTSSEQAATLEEVASSLQELESMAQQSARNAEEARRLSETAREGSQESATSMAELAEAMERIRASSEEMARILDTIDEIAFQTNLLALNAAVEAARAGEAGHGFAVVAEEVRALAMRSGEAARSTASLVDEARSNVVSGVELSARVVESLSGLEANSSKVTGMMEEIAAAANHQSEGVTQLNTAVDQMNGVTQATASSAEESSASAEDLASQAEKLRSLVARYRVSGAGETKRVEGEKNRVAERLQLV